MVPLRWFARLGALERLRAVFLAVALADLATSVLLIVPTTEPVVERALATIAAGWLALYWTRGFARGSFPLAGEPLEALAGFALFCASPGRPLLPLVAIVYRSQYSEGGIRRAFSRYGLWVLAWFGGHALAYGPGYLRGDISPAAGTALAPLAFCMLALDKRQLYVLAERLRHDATHDSLTGLANRRQLLTLLGEACAPGHAVSRVVLMILDLDNFKGINDGLGHAAGDELLVELARRLLDAVGPDATVARLGGDEFAVLALGAGAVEALQIAERACQALEHEFELQAEVHLSARASIGIAVRPEHGRDPATLIRHADVAMYCAKRSESESSSFELYDPRRDEHSRERVLLLSELPRAIRDGELVLNYQPKVDLHTGRIAGVEALVRWQHPTRGQLSPDRFLPLAEQAGLMRELTLKALDMALGQCARWRASGHDLPVAVNLAAANLLDASLGPSVARLLEHYELPPSSLVLEITERVVGTDRRRVADVLTQLREHDIALSLDDFGIGSSTLGFLSELPVQEVKLDRSFISSGSARNERIMKLIIDAAAQLGLRTVVEGIERRDSLELIARFGADEAQGFYLARPMAVLEMTGLLNNWQPLELPPPGGAEPAPSAVNRKNADALPQRALAR
ncbi:MAG TPA: EAL domain-containing protein [Solirubrobacteraceae bacterium]|jgi:diguanylate cyclase (GGDEF)-like protein|nr:EAL domain-containing protein [Solirubrobacteraceae bacterium]